MTPDHHSLDPATTDTDVGGIGVEGGAVHAEGRHASAISVLEEAVEPIVADMGYELILLEWIGGGKRRVMRLYLDHPDGISVKDCSRMSRIVGNTLDAQEVAASEGDTSVDPALLGLLRQPYVLEVSSPGIDRPLTRRPHFEAQIGGRAKLETHAPLESAAITPPPAPERAGIERKFDGRIAAVEVDEAAPDDPRRGTIVLHDVSGNRTIRVPLPRVRRANLVWEG